MGPERKFVDVRLTAHREDERLGWTGDAQHSAELQRSIWMFHHSLQKWLKDIAADQKPGGEGTRCNS